MKYILLFEQTGTPRMATTVVEVHKMPKKPHNVYSLSTLLPQTIVPAVESMLACSDFFSPLRTMSCGPSTRMPMEDDRSALHYSRSEHNENHGFVERRYGAKLTVICSTQYNYNVSNRHLFRDKKNRGGRPLLVK